MYKLGVIGGMGPLATAKYYEKVILNTPAKKDSEHINMVILNHATMPDRSASILSDDHDGIINELKKDVDILNHIGVENIAIPCNTSHYYFDEITKMTDCNVINMVEETIKEVKSRGYDKAFVFSTKGTFIAQVYEKYGEKHNVKIKELPEFERENVMRIIYEIKSNNNTENPEFNNILSKYCDKDNIGILACTELSVIELSSENEENTIDALDVLVKKSIELTK